MCLARQQAQRMHLNHLPESRNLRSLTSFLSRHVAAPGTQSQTECDARHVARPSQATLA
jgi:hypothetical protein